MTKKLICFILSGIILTSLFLSGAVTASAAEVYFSQDFSSLKPKDSLPKNFTVNNGTVTAGNGYLELSSGAVLLLPSELKKADFTYRIKFAIISANDPSRWAGFMFRYQNPAQYLQMCCTQGAASAGGINCAYYNNNVWNYPQNGKGSFDNSIDPSKTYTAKIVVNGSKIALYLNDTLCVVTTALLSDAGLFGVQTNGSIVRVYSLSVSETESVPDFVPDSSGKIKNIYEPQTGIVSAPTVIQEIDSESKLNALNTDGERTQVAKFKISAPDLSVRVGSKSYTLNEIFEKCGTAVLPLFVIDGQETARALADYITEKKLQDVILASDSTDVLRAFWDKEKRGIRYAYLAGAVTSSNTVAQISRKAHFANATIVIVDQNEQLTRKNAEYLQLRALSVWLNADKASDQKRVYDAVDCGANGVIVKDFLVAYRLYEKVTEVTPIRKTFLIGHRGYPTVAPENSKESYLEAVTAGASAIECDVQLTSDNVLVSNHDGAVTGYTTDTAATGPISGYTWENLSKFTLKPVGKYASSKFCKMEWYFQILKDNPDLVGYVELKNTSDAVAKMTAELMKSMGVEDQVLFICFDDNGLMGAKKYAPFAGTGKLSTGSYNSSSSLNSNLDTLIKTIGVTGASPDYNVSDYTQELIKAGRHRGIIFQAWTLNNLDDIVSKSRMGVDCITTDSPNFSRDPGLTAYQQISAKLLFGELVETSPVVSQPSASSSSQVSSQTDSEFSSETSSVPDIVTSAAPNNNSASDSSDTETSVSDKGSHILLFFIFSFVLILGCVAVILYLIKKKENIEQ